ncbi:MAG: DNA mismatch repair endonuclease MutL [Nanohaloarchaea archaeon]|nr:DNA mismatch repair endonuclease MutL [Candidatus Nanohaloarchaea archaeon]
MEMKIKKLEDSLISKIAAGEVIERPASIVKELVENSIDSGATQVTVNVVRAGKKLISVADNGCGMTYDDAIISFERHTTSKICDVDDLFSIHTLGFRGEALASIASVSKIEMVTNTGNSSATKIEVFGGVISDVGSAGAPRGTEIKVSDIFFNTPARKKYMKSDAVELEHIVDIVTRYALANPKVHFKLLSDTREIISTPGSDDLLSNIRNIYGRETEKNVVALDSSVKGIVVSGYVSKPALTRGSKDHQSVFVNGRYIKNKIVSDSVYNAYKTLLPKHRHPFFVLFITIDSAAIDVNIHPSKKEIKVRNDIESDLSDAVFSAVDKTLKENVLIPDAVISARDRVRDSGVAPKAKNLYKVSAGTQVTLRPSQSIVSEKASSYVGSEEVHTVDDKEVSVSSSAVSEESPVVSRLPAMKIIGQVNKTYIIAETADGMFIIDQHAAHERVVYEKFMGMYGSSDIKTQNLINVQIIELPAKESLILSSNIFEFKRYGFDIETFGKDTFIVRTVPVILGKVKSKDMIKDIIEDFINLSKSDKISEISERIIITMSCRAAIKGGEELTAHSIKTLIDELAKTENPFTCPHGRPTIINMSVSELEKKFKRVV